MKNMINIKQISKLIKGNSVMLKRIKNFEKDIKGSLCEDCQKQLDFVVKRNQNILKVAKNSRKFCYPCTQIIQNQALLIFKK